jgi:uncharacterized membrane protein YfcA
MAVAEAFPGDAKSSVGAIMPAIIVGDLIAVFWFRRQADWRKIIGLLPFVAVGMACGAALLCRTTSKGLGPILGWMVLGFLALEVWRQCFRWGAIPHHWLFSALVGAVAGFGTMIGNAAGPVMTIFFISRGMQKQELIGTAAWFFFVVNLSKVPVMTWLNMINADTVRFGFMIACFVPLGSVAGAWVLRTVSQRMFDVLALTLAGAAAIKLILS